MAGIQPFEEVLEVGPVDFDEVPAIKSVQPVLDASAKEFELARRLALALLGRPLDVLLRHEKRALLNWSIAHGNHGRFCEHSASH
jgi:hypothetical protein